MASENLYLEEIKGNVNSNISKRILDKTNLQMWSAISFAVILIGLGIPVWWKTTETYRVSIPYSRIDKLSDLKWTITLNISVFSNNPIRRDKRISELLSFFAIDNFFNVSVIPEHLNKNFSDILSFEKREQEHPRPGNIILVELEDSTHENIFLGNERAMYFYPKVSSEKLVNIIKHQILLEKRLIVSIDSNKSSIQSESDFQYNKNRIKLVPRYELIFTNIVPEPEVVKLEWESESVITSYLLPMINQLLPLVHITLKSQWLYFVEIGLGKKKKRYNDSYMFEMNSHSLTTSLLDKKLGLRASKYLCFNLVLYTARCDESPLFFSSENGYINHVLIPQWGGIQILNPSQDNCKNITSLKPNPNLVISLFIGQIRSIIGLKNYLQNDLDVKWLPITDSRIRKWEFDGLVRLQILELVTSARFTLQALIRLLDKVNNIVINEEVGIDIMRAVEYIETCAESLALNNLTKALNEAHIAFSAAETAFAHPSLLSLLYFPDDQKYAIYIPLFLPIMIPVMISVKNIWQWLKHNI